MGKVLFQWLSLSQMNHLLAISLNLALCVHGDSKTFADFGISACIQSIGTNQINQVLLILNSGATVRNTHALWDDIKGWQFGEVLNELPASNMSQDPSIPLAMMPCVTPLEHKPVMVFPFNKLNTIKVIPYVSKMPFSLPPSLFSPSILPLSIHPSVSEITCFLCSSCHAELAKSQEGTEASQQPTTCEIMKMDSLAPYQTVGCIQTSSITSPQPHKRPWSGSTHQRSNPPKKQICREGDYKFQTLGWLAT